MVTDTAPPGLLTYTPVKVGPAAFVDFWAPRYVSPKEDFYEENIGRPLTPERIWPLFVWKNMSALSARKKRTVQESFIDRRHLLDELDPDRTTPRDFLTKYFPDGGPIWRIFWLHCWQPPRYPIFDHHVWRTCRYVRDGVIEHLGELKEDPVDLYLDEYLPWCKLFAECHWQMTDRALWACGNFISDWGFAAA